MRNRIRRSDSKQVRQAKKSFNERQKRKAKLARRNAKQPLSLRELFEHDIKQTDGIEEFCKLNNIEAWGRRTSKYIKLPNQCTLFDSPDKVLKILLHIFSRAKFFSEFPVIKVQGSASFGALYLIDNMCWAIGTKRNWGVTFRNMNPEDNAIFSKIHSKKEDEDGTIISDGSAYLINERVKISRSNDALTPQPYSVIEKKMTDMITLAMKKHSSPDFELSHEQRQAISSTIGESFDNIKSHVPNAEHGYLCGFYDPVKATVTILVFNFGQTISDTLEGKLPEKVQVEIESVISNHKRMKILKPTFTRRNALTLLALQEGISSKLSADNSRGHGLIDYIANCFSLSDKCRISIVSGDTFIRIDNRYKVGHKFFVDRERRMLAFNPNNDIYSLPDSRYVKKLGVVFNGVIIETTIPLCS